MPPEAPYVGQRLSLRSQLCTIRFVGQVTGKQSIWLGVEWDDDTRGKHDGKHEGTQYFYCRSTSPTAASFLRPDQKWDQPLTFLEALSQKYFQQDQARSDEIIYVSRSKQMEEVGFEKFALRQAQLKGIKTVVLDQWCIQHKTGQDRENITKTCSHITDLDVRSNLFETWDDILDISSCMPGLRRLSVEDNRFLISDIAITTIESLRSLNLSNTLLNEAEVSKCLASAPNLQELIISNNRIQIWKDVEMSNTLETIDISHNDISTLCDVSHILKLSSVTSVKMQHNRIEGVWQEETAGQVLSTTLADLDLGHNYIKSWRFFDCLRTALPSLKHLRIAGNPIFTDLRSVDDKPLTTADGYMLVIARLPQLQTLNYSAITDKERLNAEKYYLSQIALQMTLSDPARGPEILRQHPLWSALCQDYGEPEIDRTSLANTIDPKSLAARLVKIDFYTRVDKNAEWSTRLPKSFNLYAVHGVVGKILHVMPLRLRLILETDEEDPLGKATSSSDPTWWDSDDEEGNVPDTFIKREIELLPSTRTLAAYIDGEQARIRIELKDT